MAQSITSVQAVEVARDLLIPAISGLRLVPGWAILATVLLAASAICATVIVRSRAEFQSSSGQHERIVNEIDLVRGANTSLQLEIHRLANDPNAIEVAARERLGMVKATDVVVTTGSIKSSSMVSFVR
ncbi:MAG: hypothetical protein DMF73_12630 [Acidobacteria bacterium]|nr:MAG: hypothetical protein DMF73_12630 [Acidobacteriota bacterium]